MATIDENVVQIKMDDKQFNKASEKTISKLEQLKQALKFDGAVDNFKTIEKAAKAVDLSPMEKGVEFVGHQFNALATIADAALRRITNKAMAWGESMVKSLTIDNVSAGFSKYEQKVGAVQTIMAATADQFEDTGKQMEYVNAQLDKLNWFTDETSYHFLEMVQNIGKFTANQIPLEQSVTAMQGIATWAARSGANANEAGRAMYNLSQAIAVGSVKLIDWKSIENANMSTAEFKKTAIETAEALGTLKKVTEDTYETLGGKTVSVKNFNENLSEGWFSSDVLLKTLDKYGNFAVRLQELDELTDVGATGLIAMVDDFVDGTLDMNDAMQMTGLSAQELTRWLEELGSEENALGRAALKAAQESKTFTDVIDYVKESVSTGWSKTFEYIFGDYEEAKELWSEVAESMYDVFVASGDMRNGVLRDWKQLGGRTYLLDGVRKVFENLSEIVSSFIDVFRDIFPRKTADDLLQITYNFEQMTESLKLSEKEIESLQNAFRPFVELLKGLWETIKVVVKAFEPVYILFNQLAGAALYLAGELGKLASSFLGLTFSTDSLDNLYTVLNTIAKILTGSVYLAINLVIQGITNLLTFIRNVKTTFQQGEGGIRGFITALITNLQLAFQSIKAGESIVGKTVTAIIGVVTKVIDVIRSLFDSITGGEGKEGTLGKIFSSMAQGVADSGILDVLGGIALALTTIIGNIFNAVANLNDAESDLRKVIDGIIGVLSTLWNWLVNELSQMSMRDVADVALVIFIGGLVNSFWSMTKSMTLAVNAFKAQITGVGGAITGFLKTLSGETSTLSNVTANLKGVATATKYAQMALAVYSMVWGLTKLSEIPAEDLTKATIVLGLTTGALIALMKVLQKVSSSSGGGGGGGGSGNINKAADNIIKFAAAVGILSAALYAVGHMDLAQIGKGLLGLIGVLGSLFAFLAAMHKFKIAGSGMKKIGMTILPVALGIAALAAPMAIFAQFSWEGLGKGLTTVFTLLGTIAGAMAIIGKFGGSTPQVLAGALAIDMVALSVTALAIPIAALSALNMDQLAQAMMIMTIQLAAVAGAITLLSRFGGSVGNILAAAVAMTAVSAAVGVLALAVAGMSALPMQQMWSAIGGLVAVLGALVGVAALAGFFMPISAGLMAISVALAALAAVILSVGASFMMFGIGVKNFAEGVAIIAGLAVGIATAGAVVGDDFPAMIEKGLDNVMFVLKAFLARVPELTYEMTYAFLSIFTAILVALFAIIPDLLKGLLWIGKLLLDAIAAMAEPIVDALSDLLDGLTRSVPRLLDSAAKFLDALAKGLGEMFWDFLISVVQGLLNSVGLGFVSDILDKFHTWGDESGESYVKGLEHKIDEDKWRAGQAAEELGEEVDNGVKTRMNRASAEDAANDYVDGYISGINDRKKEAYDVSAELGNMSVQGIRSKDGIDAHSPGEEPKKAGVDAVLGFVEGIELNLPSSFDMGALLGNTFTNGLFDSLETGLFDVQGLIDSFFGRKTAPNKHALSNLEDKSILGAKVKGNLPKAKKDAEDTGEEIGESYDEGFASGLSGGSSSSGTSKSKAEEKAKTVAEQVEDAYESELKHLDLATKQTDLEFNLWEQLNVNVDETEKKARQIEYVNAKMIHQIDRMRIAGEKYEQILEGMGEDAVETKEAYNEWLQEQIDLEELQNELYDLQNEVIDKNAELLEKIEQGEKQLAQGYKLWGLIHQNATDAEKAVAELSNLQGQLDQQVLRTKITGMTYQEAVQQYGANSKEALEAQYNYVDEVSKVVELQNQITAKQKEGITDQSEAFKEYARITGEDSRQGSFYRETQAQAGMVEAFRKEYIMTLEEYGEAAEETQKALQKLREEETKYSDMQRSGGNKMSLRQSLKEQGFSDEEIAAYFRQQAGIVEQAATETIDLSVDNMMDQARALLETFGITLETGVMDMEVTMQEVGKTYVTAIGDGMTTNSTITTEAATATILEVAEDVSVDKDIYQSWYDIGYNIDIGVKEGIEAGKSEVINSVIDMVRAAIAAAKAAAGIHSPSTVTEGMGYFLDKGLIVGLEKNAETVARAAAKTMQKTLSSMSNIVRTSNMSDFVSNMVFGGIDSEAKSYSAQLLSLSTKFVKNAEKEFDETLGDLSEYADVFEALGLDVDDLSYNLVIGLDTDKAEEDLTDLERLLLRYREKQSDIKNMNVMEWEEWLGPSDKYDRLRDLNANKELRNWIMRNDSRSIEEKVADYTAQWEAQRDWDAKHLTYTEMLGPKELESMLREYYSLTERHEEVTEEYEQYVRDFWNGPANTLKEIADLIESADSESGTSSSQTVGDLRPNYTQNIYSTRPLSTLDVYRNTNQLLSKFQ